MNVGVLGAGYIAPVFVQHARQNSHYHITAVWSKREEELDKFNELVDYTTTDLNRIMNDTSIDVIYIGLPNKLHYEYAMKALLSNKSVIVEKPFCHNYDLAKELIDLAAQKNLFVFEAIMTRYHKNYIDASKQIDKLGDIRIIEGNFSQFSRRYEKFKDGIILPAFSKELAGGALMDLGIYNIHFVCGMFGEPKDVHYYANIVNGVDTSGILVLDYGNFKASLVNAKDSTAKSHLLIQGDEGTMELTSTTSRCAQFRFSLFNGDEFSYEEGKDEEFAGMPYELEVFGKLYESHDLTTCQKYNEETLITQKVLKRAMASAGLNYD